MTHAELRTPWRTNESVAERCNAVLRRLPTATDGNISTLVAQVAVLVGRPIKILPVGDSRWEQLTGLTLDGGGSYAILIRPTDAIYYQIHCILHELAHLLFGHKPTSGVDRMQGQFGPSRVIHVRLIETDDAPMTESDLESEGEAEYLAHLLGARVLRPRYAEGEEVFG